jgi:hypothetical protein
LRGRYGAELGSVPFSDIRRLISSEYDEARQIGAELLGAAKELDRLAITEWLELLQIENLDVLTRVCELATSCVTPARVTLDQCVEMACRSAAPVAQLGLEWARQKPIRHQQDLATVLRTARARVATVRTSAVEWCVGLVGSLSFATGEHIRDLCDAPHADARAPALACLGHVDRFRNDLRLWFDLTESPYDDVRSFLAREARTWATAAAPGTLARFWATALLSVHTGSSTKPRVARDVADRLVQHPAEGETLLPLLGLLLRSIRPAERMAALAAITRAALTSPAVRVQAMRYLPELVVSEQVTS